MALPNPAPLPPELASPNGRPPDSEFAALFAAAAADALDSGARPGALVLDLAESEDAPRWSVTDMGSAEWAMRHVAVADVELAELQAQAEEWAQRIAAWFARASAEAAATKAFFEHHLQRYALDERARTGGRVKSVVLPSGVVSTRGPKVEGATRVVIKDEDAVLTWAELEDVLDEVAPPKPRSVLLTPLRDLVQVVDHDDGTQSVITADGAPVPGVAVEPVPTTATVTAELP